LNQPINAVGAENAAAFPSKNYFGAELIGFGRVWLDLVETWGN